MGLTADQLAQICSEGVQFNANELQAGKGSGLGLFISKGLIEQHGGKLTVASAGIGKGTTFCIELPLFFRTQKRPSASSTSQRYQIVPDDTPQDDLALLGNAPSMAATIRASIDSTEFPHSKESWAQVKRVLVVDDAASNRKMLIRILTSHGYVCEQAEDGQQAIERYVASVQSGERLHSIIMDYEMPVMNGPTATKKLREMGCTLPILGVTGNLLPDDVAFYKAQGANQVFGKPLNLAKFECFIHDHEEKCREERVELAFGL